MRKLYCFAILIPLLFIGCGNDVSYYTKHGMAVTVGEINMPGQLAVEEWTDDVMDFWEGTHYCWAQCMRRVNQDTHTYFSDEESLISSDGDEVAGLAWTSGKLEIALNEPWRVRAVFIHEISHRYLRVCGDTGGGNGDHAIMRERGLHNI